MNKPELRPFDAAVYLHTEEERREYMKAAQEDGHPSIIEIARNDIERSRTLYPNQE